MARIKIHDFVIDSLGWESPLKSPRVKQYDEHVVLFDLCRSKWNDRLIGSDISHPTNLFRFFSGWICLFTAVDVLHHYDGGWQTWDSQIYLPRDHISVWPLQTWPWMWRSTRRRHAPIKVWLISIYVIHDCRSDVFYLKLNYDSFIPLTTTTEGLGIHKYQLHDMWSELLSVQPVSGLCSGYMATTSISTM